MYIFLIYLDCDQRELIAYYKFTYLKDIILFSNNLFRYSDIILNKKIKKKRVYKTYKRHFKVIEISPLDKYNYFNKK